MLEKLEATVVKDQEMLNTIENLKKKIQRIKTNPTLDVMDIQKDRKEFRVVSRKRRKKRNPLEYQQLTHHFELGNKSNNNTSHQSQNAHVLSSLHPTISNELLTGSTYSRLKGNRPYLLDSVFTQNTMQPVDHHMLPLEQHSVSHSSPSIGPMSFHLPSAPYTPYRRTKSEPTSSSTDLRSFVSSYPASTQPSTTLSPGVFVSSSPHRQQYLSSPIHYSNHLQIHPKQLQPSVQIPSYAQQVMPSYNHLQLQQPVHAQPVPLHQRHYSSAPTNPTLSLPLSLHKEKYLNNNNNNNNNNGIKLYENDSASSSDESSDGSMDEDSSDLSLVGRAEEKNSGIQSAMSLSRLLS